jgi:hypothetical protein
MAHEAERNSIEEKVMSFLNQVQKVSQQVGLAIGLTAATAGVAEAATQIYAFTNDDCYKTTIQLNRGENYWFPVGDVNIRGTINDARGRASWEDAFNVVANVTAAFYTEGREHGVTGSYAFMKGCTGSWAEYCGSVTAVEKNGRLPSNFQALIDNNMCRNNSSTRRMFEAIVANEPRPAAPAKTVVVPAQPAIRQEQTVVTTNNGVTQTCRVDNGCVHVELQFTP